MDFIERTDQQLRNLIRTFSANAVKVTSKLMGASLLIYGLVVLYIGSNGNLTEASWTAICGTVVMIICSFLIMVDFSFDLNRTIGLYAIGLSVNRIFKNLNYLVLDGTSELSTIMIFVFGIVMLAVSCNLFYTGVVFLRGQARKRISMLLSTLLLILLTAGMIYFATQEYNVSYVELLSIRPDHFVMLLLCLLLIIMLETKTVRDSETQEHYLAILRGIRSTSVTSPNAFIYRNVAEVLCRAFVDRSDWIMFTGNGPVEEQYGFTITNRNNDLAHVTVQKWKGSDVLYFTLSDHEGGSVINAYRFTVTSIEPRGTVDTCDMIDIYGKDEHFQLSVRNVPVKKRWGIAVNV